MEALACGTPCVAFNIGGLPDMIESGENGYLAVPFESDDLAKGIAWVLEDTAESERLRVNAREKVEREYNLESIANKYAALYQQLLSSEKIIDNI
jgi:glycosyltransferase involved in cell wall biosynthesis